MSKPKPRPITIFDIRRAVQEFVPVGIFEVLRASVSFHHDYTLDLRVWIPVRGRRCELSLHRHITGSDLCVYVDARVFLRDVLHGLVANVLDGSLAFRPLPEISVATWNDTEPMSMLPPLRPLEFPFSRLLGDDVG